MWCNPLWGLNRRSPEWPPWSGQWTEQYLLNSCCVAGIHLLWTAFSLLTSLSFLQGRRWVCWCGCLPHLLHQNELGHAGEKGDFCKQNLSWWVRFCPCFCCRASQCCYIAWTKLFTQNSLFPGSVLHVTLPWQQSWIERFFPTAFASPATWGPQKCLRGPSAN